jgi:hypothetical protein
MLGTLDDEAGPFTANLRLRQKSWRFFDLVVAGPKCVSPESTFNSMKLRTTLEHHSGGIAIRALTPQSGDFMASERALVAREWTKATAPHRITSIDRYPSGAGPIRPARSEVGVSSGNSLRESLTRSGQYSAFAAAGLLNRLVPKHTLRCPGGTARDVCRQRSRVLAPRHLGA